VPVGIKELLRNYHGLEPTEQAAFAGMIRAHRLFNTGTWREELCRRHLLLERNAGVPVADIEKLVETLERG
jgi:hypothetical protein